MNGNKPIVEYAVETAIRRGWPVFPVKGKFPLTTHGFKDASRDESVIRQLFAAHPAATGYGIATGNGFCVLDVDIDHGGLDSFTTLLNDPRGFPSSSLAVRTGSGGFHIYMKTPVDVPSSAGKLARGVDVRGRGGYVLGAGSIHPDTGERYGWLNDETVVADAPGWLVEVLREPPVEEANETEPSAFIAQGERNTKLTSLAGTMRRRGMAASAILAALKAENLVRCVPPLPTAEVERIATSVARYRTATSSSELFKTTGLAEPQLKTAAEIMALKIPDIPWVVQGLLPPGLGALTGPPKAGKSLLALQIALHVAGAPGLLLGNQQVWKGKVLVLAMEDTWRRLQGRLRAFGSWPDWLSFATVWPTTDSGGLEKLNAWAEENHPDARMVVIDTLQLIRPGVNARGSMYEQDYRALTPLKQFADAHNLTVLLVHHTRKQDDPDVFATISGTHGLSGALDSMMVLRRDRSRADAVLHVTGRDLEDQELALTFEHGVWAARGPADEFRLSQDQQAILDLLRKSAEALSPTEIAERLGRNPANIKKTVYRMQDAGLVKKVERGLYTAAPIPLVPNVPLASESPKTGTEGPQGTEGTQENKGT